MEAALGVAEAVKQERQEISGYVDQLRELHSDNRSAVTVLDFLQDLIRNREEND